MIQRFAAAKCDVNEALYEADKALEKFAAALRECACLQDGGQSRRRIANVCFILRNMSINCLHLCLRLLCRLLLRCKLLSNHHHHHHHHHPNLFEQA